MRKYLYEVFEEIEGANGNRTEIKNIITKYKSPELRVYFAAAYNPQVKPKFTKETIPEYTPDDAPVGMTYTTLATETRRIFYFYTPGKDCDQNALERMYINIAEGLHPKEAKLFEDIVLKQLYIKGLDYEVINAGFGEEFLPPPEEKKE